MARMDKEFKDMEKKGGGSKSSKGKKGKKKKSGKKIIIGCLVVIAIAAAALVIFFSGRVKLYGGDDDDTTGNTSGNLLNGGLFCECDGSIYFANPYDQNTLYVMKDDLSGVKQISKDNVSYLNVAGKYIFYTKRNDKKTVDSDVFMAFSTTGLYRITTKGKKLGRLYDDPTQVACLYGNYVYYQHYDQTNGLWLYRTRMDAKDETKLLEEPCAPYVVHNHMIYYTGAKNDHAIHYMNITGGGDTLLLDGNFTALTLQGDYLYFLDMGANYSLKRMLLSGGNVETLIDARLATYNVAENGDIFCQVDNGTDDNGLYYVGAGTRSLQLIQKGNFNYLNLAGNYLFYEEYDQSKAYLMDLTSFINEEFRPEE